MADLERGGFIDRVIEGALAIVSPRAARLRAHHRRMASDGEYAAAFGLMARMRGYKAATPGPNKTGWLHESNRTADGEIVPSLPSLRNKTRAAFRDDAIAAGLKKNFNDHVIGTGFKAQSRAVTKDGKPDATKRAALDGLWRRRANTLCPAEGHLAHGAHQRLVYSQRNEAGEVWLKATITEPGEPVWIETIEGQRCATPSNARPVDPLGRIVDGIEKDRFGRVVAYWIRKTDPGDTGTPNTVGHMPSQSTTTENFDRLPYGPLVKHVRRGVERAGQSHGVPLLHACLQDIRDFDLLFLACLKRTQLAACLAAFIKSSAEPDDLIELTAEDYGYQLDQKLEPGLMWRLLPGESIEQIKPETPFGDIWPLFMVAARRIGASIGISPQAVLRVWENINYSGARTITLDDQKTYDCERQDFDDEVLDWEWTVVQTDALLRGDPELLAAGVTLEDVGLVEWIPNADPWVDPVSQGQAIELKLRLGLSTYQRECAREGTDWRENIRADIERELYENEQRKAANLPPKASASVLAGGSASSEPEQDDEDQDEEDDADESAKAAA